MVEQSPVDEIIAGRRSEHRRMPEDMPRWMARTITGIDALNR